MVCFELFARTAIRRLMGVSDPLPQTIEAHLLQRHQTTGGRPTYHPAYLEQTRTEATVMPVRWHGSSDLQATVGANAMIVFPGENGTLEAGQVVQVIKWD
jgi:molybdopterin molybdotransferase